MGKMPSPRSVPCRRVGIIIRIENDSRFVRTRKIAMPLNVTDVEFYRFRWVNADKSCDAFKFWSGNPETVFGSLEIVIDVHRRHHNGMNNLNRNWDISNVYSTQIFNSPSLSIECSTAKRSRGVIGTEYRFPNGDPDPSRRRTRTNVPDQDLYAFRRLLMTCVYASFFFFFCPSSTK
jgi:hypothetical protein